MPQTPEHTKNDFTNVIGYLDEIFMQHKGQPSGRNGQPPSNSQSRRLVDTASKEPVVEHPRRPLWGDHRTSESAPEDAPPRALHQQQLVDQEPELHKPGRRSIQEWLKKPPVILRLVLVGSLALSGAVVSHKAIPETATAKIAAVVPLVEPPESNALHITPQLNCTDPMASLSFGVSSDAQMNYAFITDPAEQEKAGKDPNFKPTKTIFTLDPKAPPEFTDPALQQMEYTTGLTAEELAAGKTTSQNTATQTRLRGAYFSGPNVQILACPTDSDPSAYIQRKKDNQYVVDASKLKLVMLAGENSANGWQAWYDTNQIDPGGPAERKSIADKEISRINKELLPDPDKPTLNPKIVNHIIREAVAQLTSPQCQKPLLDAVANGMAANLRQLSAEKNYYSVKGQFISPKESWESAHKPEDYSSEAKLINSKVVCTNFKSLYQEN